MKKNPTGKQHRRKPKPELKWQTGAYDRHAEIKFILPYQFLLICNAIIFATGYQTATPAFLHPIRHLMIEKAKRNYAIDAHDTVFLQNAEQPTHGFNAPNLSLGPYRNAVILNSILGYDHYQVETGSCFQSFGLPE